MGSRDLELLFDSGSNSCEVKNKGIIYN